MKKNYLIFVMIIFLLTVSFCHFAQSKVSEIVSPNHNELKIIFEGPDKADVGQKVKVSCSLRPTSATEQIYTEYSKGGHTIDIQATPPQATEGSNSNAPSTIGTFERGNFGTQNDITYTVVNQKITPIYHVAKSGSGNHYEFGGGISSMLLETELGPFTTSGTTSIKCEIYRNKESLGSVIIQIQINEVVSPSSSTPVATSIATATTQKKILNSNNGNGGDTASPSQTIKNMMEGGTVDFGKIK